MPDAPASDTAMHFADYVLENYIAWVSNFRLPCGYKPPDLLFLIQRMALSVITAI